MSAYIGYKDLNIHQRINLKNHFGICADRGEYHSSCSVRLNGVLKRATEWVNPNPWYYNWYFKR